jgi:hypothetical protein
MYILNFKAHIVLIPFFIILCFFGVKESFSKVKNIRNIATYRKLLLNDLKRTRKTNWYFQDYWQSYVLSFMSKEKIKVSNSSLERFLPYKLSLYSANERNFLVNSFQGKYIKEKYDFYGIRYRLIKRKLYYIFYDIKSKINYWTINSKKLKDIPNIHFEGVVGEYLVFLIKSKNNSNIRLNINIASNLTDKYEYRTKLNDKIKIKIPSYFYGKYVKMSAFIDYYGTTIPKSLIHQNIEIKRPVKHTDNGNNIYYLRGGFEVKKEIKGYTHGRGVKWKEYIAVKKGRVIEKNCKILINEKNVIGVNLNIKNIIDFNRYIWWRPDYKQVVSIEYNNNSKNYILEDGKTNIHLNFENDKNNKQEIYIRTKYVLPFIFDEFGYIESGVIVENLEILH